MYKDIFGKNRLKINLHTHTTDSDGSKTPEQAAKIYKNKGYDIIAITDHWKYRESGEICGLRTIAGIEYDYGNGDASDGVYHILMTGGHKSPKLQKGATVQEMIDEIIKCGGMPTLAHPAWSMNTVEQFKKLKGVYSTEIYNSVSDAHESSRPYSGCFADASACAGLKCILLATDDAHFYDGSDETKSYIMLEGNLDMTDDEILENIKAGKFYSTQGPEVHIRQEGDEIIVNSSPVSRISLFTNCVWGQNHCLKGESITELRCKINPIEKFIRAEVTDINGKMAWTNYITII